MPTLEDARAIASARRKLDRLRAEHPAPEPDPLESARTALAQLAEQRRSERDRAGSSLMRDHARFSPTSARLCGDGGGGLLADAAAHAATLRGRVVAGQSE